MQNIIYTFILTKIQLKKAADPQHHSTKTHLQNDRRKGQTHTTNVNKVMNHTQPKSISEDNQKTACIHNVFQQDEAFYLIRTPFPDGLEKTHHMHKIV
jgi:hypothetical protein